MKKGNNTALFVGGGLALLALLGGGIYLATRGKTATTAPDQEALADARAREAEAKAAQARADAARATAEAQKAAAKAADKPLWEEVVGTVVDDLGDFFGGLAKSGSLF